MSLLNIDLNNTSKFDFSPYEVERAFEEWLADQGFTHEAKSWRPKGGGFECRMRAQGDKARKTSVIARYYTDKPAQGWYRSFKDGIGGDKITWRYIDYLKGEAADTYRATQPPREELERIKKERIEAEKREEAELREQAIKSYDQLLPADTKNNYLSKKNVQAYEGVRQDKRNNVIIPLFNAADLVKPMTFQTITPTGDKYFIPDLTTAGGLFIIGKPNGGKIGLAEGYATGATVHELTGIPIIVTFNCGNLTKVAETVKEYIPGEYLIFADNDKANEKDSILKHNHGMEAARKAAVKLGIDSAHIIAPSAENDNTDWQDVAAADREAAKAEITELLQNALMSPEQRKAERLYKSLSAPTIDKIQDLQKKKGSGLDIGFKVYGDINGRLEEMPLLFRGMNIIAARTGGGKTTSLTVLAARVLTEKPEARILFISLEESEDSIYRRIMGAWIASNENLNNVPLYDIEAAILNYGAWRQARARAAAVEMDISGEQWQSIKAASQILEERVIIADLLSVPEASKVDVAAGLIQSHVERYGQDGVIFIDYIQKLKPSEKFKQTGGYQDFKNVMEKLQPFIAAGRYIFAGAQMNRETAKNNPNNAEAEFKNVYPELIREAADIEQAAEVILFCNTVKIGYDNTYINYRVLKNRRGLKETTMSMPIDFTFGGAEWSRQQEAFTAGSELDITALTNKHKRL